MNPACKRSLYTLTGAGLLCFAACSMAQDNVKPANAAINESSPNNSSRELPKDANKTPVDSVTSDVSPAHDVSPSSTAPQTTKNTEAVKPVASPYANVNNTTPRIGSGAHLLNVTLGLSFIVALIFGISWFVRRFGQGTFSSNTHMRIIAAMPLGTRERIVLIDAGGQQLLLGITPTQINTLHVFDTPVVTNTSETNSSDFSRKLMAILQRSGNDETNNNKSFKKQE